MPHPSRTHVSIDRLWITQDGVRYGSFKHQGVSGVVSLPPEPISIGDRIEVERASNGCGWRFIRVVQTEGA